MSEKAVPVHWDGGGHSWEPRHPREEPPCVSLPQVDRRFYEDTSLSLQWRVSSGPALTARDMVPSNKEVIDSLDHLTKSRAESTCLDFSTVVDSRM